MNRLLHRHCRTAFVCLSMWVCFGAGAGAETLNATGVLSRYPSDVVKKLNEKKLVVLSSVAGQSDYVEALVIFEKPRHQVFRMLSQTARQIEYIPEIDSIETIRRNGTAVIDEHHLRIMFIRIDYRIRTDVDPKVSRIWWELDIEFDNDLRALKGFWELYEIDETRTLARFGTHVEVGPILPSIFQEIATRRQVPRIMERVRYWVDSDGAYRP